jgi:hypothetical protein
MNSKLKQFRRILTKVLPTKGGAAQAMVQEPEANGRERHQHEDKVLEHSL